MEQVVDQTEIRVKQPSPDHGYCCRSCNHRKENDRTICSSSSHLSVQQNCQNQCDTDRKRNFYDRIFEGIDQCLPDFRTSEYLFIVFKTDKDISFTEITGLKKALINCLENRDNI